MALAEEIVEVVTGLRYFSAFSFTVVFYDYVITIDDEVNAIWNNPSVRWHSKAVFVANRYVTAAILALAIYLVIIIRIYRLWDRKASVARTLAAIFMVFISTTIILGVFTVLRLERNEIFCAPSYVSLWSQAGVSSHATGCWSSFDFVLLLFVVFNAMDRPRPTDVPIVSALQKDGVGILLALFVVRFANFIISIFLDMSKVFVAITTLWALYTILNARLHMRLEALTSSRSHGPIIRLANM
ncbi:hypothetical protein B0H13DRAFT_2453210 [Mycena leptocephala]|nr:hypothetical protein B0H13DRAFT_2453210 [Mycena leptocephala]